MLFNYFKSKNISKRGKVIALSVVGGVFILVAFLAIWKNNIADTLIDYAPDDTVFYIHFSRPKINNAEKIDLILKNIFVDFGIKDYESLDINREVAVVGRLNGDEVKYGLIIKTDRPARTKKILLSSGLDFKVLSYNKFLIATANWSNDYQINKDNFVKNEVSKRFHSLSTINIYAASEFFDNNDDLNLKMIYSLLKNENNDLIVNFKAHGHQLKMNTGGISSVVSRYSPFKLKNLKESISGDLVFASNDIYSLIQNWQDNLKTISSADYELFSVSKIATSLNTYLFSDNHNILVVAQKNNNNSGWIFGDYDFYVSTGNIYTTKIEEILKSIMAVQYPMTKSVYLSDGTRVSELVPDISSYSFLEKNGLMYLYSPDEQFSFIYQSDGHNIRVSNNENMINQNWSKPDANYLQFKTQILPDNSITRYFKMFESIEVSEQGLILK